MTRFSSALALVLVLALAACGSDDEPAKTTASKAAAPAGTPFPDGDMWPLQSGTTYTTRKFQPALSITPGKGKWTAEVGDRPEHLAAALDVTRGQAIIGFHRMTQVFDPDAGGKIPGDAVEGPADFAEWLTTHPRLNATKPKPASLLGLDGVRIDITTKSSPKRIPNDCGKFEPPCLPLFYDGFEPVIYGGDWKGRFYVLDQGDRQLVVEQAIQPPRRFESLVKQLDVQLDAVEIARG
jgi:hypothetical protein